METSSFLQFVTTYGYFGLYALVAVEAFEFIFSFPLSPLLVTLGALSSQGTFIFVWLWLAAWAGAMTGDMLGYALGRKAGRPILERLTRRWLKPVVLEKSEHFFNKYGAWAVFFGRFIFASLAAPINLLAGVSKMRFRTFFIADALGQAVWATAYLTLGYFVGPVVIDWIERIARVGTSIPALLIVAFLLSLFLVHLRRKRRGV
ncbi:MAG: DedA family protein [Patescibacteria group bacterium]|jgi:membrane protein DedA with SNARE-associated domain